MCFDWLAQMYFDMRLAIQIHLVFDWCTVRSVLAVFIEISTQIALPDQSDRLDYLGLPAV